MKKKICALCMLALLTTACGKIPKLSNGDEAVITYENGHKISANELYEKMKDSFALEALITLSDTYILETEFEDYKKEALEYAEAHVKAYMQQYGGEESFLQAVQQAGYSTIEAYQEYAYLNYLQSHAIEEYSKDQITDKEIETYYNDTVKGDLDLSHILITPDVKTGSTDEEKKAAEDKAKETVKEIIDKLKAAENVEEEFKKLAKEYSKDESTKETGSLGKITYGDLGDEYDELLDAAYKLKDGDFSTSIITTELGYHVILRTKSYDKESLDDLKDEIRDKLALKLRNSQKDISITALQHYRKKYGVEIVDSELKKQYANYIQNILASFQNTDNK
ncbi:MAG: peptidylprolyl isomerase [Bacilli bacterium]|nr:peptidylprolyl isomerase [Bacilli bacterium]